MQLKKDKKTKAHLKIGVEFLEKELFEHQIKLMVLDERVESGHTEFCAGEEFKQHKAP